MIKVLKASYVKLENKFLKNDFWKKLMRNFILAITGQGGAAAINLITLFLMTYYLGTKTYGIFVLAQSYMLVIDTLINFQSWRGVIKFGCEAIEEKDEYKLASTIKAGFFIDIVSAILGTIIGIIIAPIIVSMLKWNTEMISIMIIFCVEIISHINGTPTAVLRIMQRFNLVAMHSIVSALMKLLIVLVYFINYKVSINTFIWAYVAADIFKNIFLVYLALKVINKEIGIKKVVDSSIRKVEREFYSYTIWTNLTATCDMPIKYFDVFFLSTISVEIVGVYKVFKQILQFFGMITNPMSQAVMPQLAEVVAKKEMNKAYSVVIKIRNIILKILLPIGMIVIILSPFIFKRFLDPIYSENCLIFILLLIINIITLSYTALHPCFSVMGFAKENTFIVLISNICYISIAYVLINIIGVYGIIIATAMQIAIVNILKINKIKKVIKLEQIELNV